MLVCVPTCLIMVVMSNQRRQRAMRALVDDIALTI